MSYQTITNQPSGYWRVAEIEIEPVRFGDLRGVAALQKRAFKPKLAYGLGTLLLLWSLPTVQFVVARRKGQVIGCAIGDRDGGQSRVVNICVDPSEQGKGFGGKLLRRLEQSLPHGDVLLMVESDNEKAQSLYRNEGYTQVGVSRDYYGRGKDGIWMQKHRTDNAPRTIRI